MSSRKALALVVSLALSGAVVWAHGHHHHEGEIKELITRLMDSALVTLDEAIEIALNAHPGHAVKAELEGEYVDGKMIATYDVEISGADGAIYEIMLDSRDGRVLKEITEYEDEDEAEQREFQKAMQAAWLDLNTCIRKAEGEGKGRAVEAELEIDDGIPVCEVVTFDGEKLYEIEMDMRNGDVIEIELEDFDEDAGDDDEDEEEEEHEHGRHHDRQHDHE